MAGSTKQGRKGRKIGRNFRYAGHEGSITNYRQRRALNVPKGGNNGAWRKNV